MAGRDIGEQLGALLPRLRRFGLALAGSRTEAEDLVQLACERALSRTYQLREADRLDAWLYGIMRHLWQDELRRRVVRRHEPLEVGENVPGPDESAWAESRLELSRVRASLLSLPAEQRTVLTLVCVDGLTYRDAASVLGIPIGTVMSRLARARRELHARLTHADEMVGKVVPLPARGRSSP